ncbi:hypothetical protein PE074_02090 [Wohlfahrtiimonas chitiniclastica]|uniref:Uncharacterized protein n=2 Tax=Wohlfahrtiimonas chitiniclastica TaxID=400946 RepID=L8XUL3_9GAMM|nr:MULTISPECIES: hypothetical protein [Wohlfahrtiimonas]ELV07738.1 Hypothetical protein F387_01218 [Wohlfahrtiimonas chitiniclastica SH04]KZS23356.1 hypothetical protein BMY_1213 [Wohlfahrtiimonas chitiniclastica]KZX37041.1 hypothetical protein A6V30_06675 [Wohlfahrtiimonas chitiniclastica]MBS7815420.1 hypothetical protein [Wohlfahrtiimonas chitiniclastica]MBS7817633.1 hypothetical protein [Wohlfahrtiimonas chitiniclastica]
MLKFNTFIFYLGIFLTGLGLVVGLPLIIIGYQDVGMYLTTMIAPLGFLLFFTGFIGAVALRPHEERIKSDVESRQKAEKYQRTVPD